ncbi:MAG: ABC transporter ATP-binding protein [Clostridium sp.]|jgi:putative ABC transport system ATP-binding protein|nr:ABC transporter ATP-binding protein [Clostridium sp.]
MEKAKHFTKQTEMMPILKFDSIKKKYDKVVLKDLSLEIFKGEMVGIIGKSGAGKTTLLNLAGFLEAQDDGNIIYNGQVIDIKNERLLAEFRRSKIGFIVQNYALIGDRNVFYNIALPLLCKKEKMNHMRKKCVNIAEKLEIGDLLDKFPNELSGGEAQRVAIARALVKEPEIILADEPTGALDSITEQEILRIFTKLVQENIAILLVTHNMEVAKKCDRVFELEKGKMKEVNW